MRLWRFPVLRVSVYVLERCNNVAVATVEVYKESDDLGAGVVPNLVRAEAEYGPGPNAVRPRWPCRIWSGEKGPGD